MSLLHSTHIFLEAPAALTGWLFGMARLLLIPGTPALTLILIANSIFKYRRSGRGAVVKRIFPKMIFRNFLYSILVVAILITLVSAILLVKLGLSGNWGV